MSAPSTEVAPLFSTRLVLVGPWAELFLLQVAPPRSVPALSLVGADSRGTFGPTLCLAATVGREAGLSWPFPTASMSFSLPLTCGWLWLPCVPGWAWGGPPRISASLHPRRRMGPHVCFSGFGSGCCPGWMPSPGSGQCTLREYTPWCLAIHHHPRVPCEAPASDTLPVCGAEVPAGVDCLPVTELP